MSNNEYDYYFNGGIDETKDFKDFMSALEEVGAFKITEMQEIPCPVDSRNDL